MARRTDSMWRDADLAAWHKANRVPFPAAGMTLPMVEYDRGVPVGLINYIRHDQLMPTGSEAFTAYSALSILHRDDDTQLPFITARYNPENWSFWLIGHNESGRVLAGGWGWNDHTEAEFVDVLYRMRGRPSPCRGKLERFWVVLNDVKPVTGLEASDVIPCGPDWHGRDMSRRRRGYEPEGQGVRFSMRNPCADIDLAVITHEGTVGLLVDYKRDGAFIQPGHKTHQAMSRLTLPSGVIVPSMITSYRPSPKGSSKSEPLSSGWMFRVHPLNESAVSLLDDFPEAATDELTGQRWLDVLGAATL